MRLRPSLRWLLCVLLLATAWSAAPAAEVDLDAPLPVDPAIRMEELPNGLRVWIRHNETPPDRVSMYLHVGSGSLNEEEDERGLAHFLEHMAFNGSEHFPPGELVKYFESIGLRFGSDQNAYTSFNETTYTLTLPDTDRETVDKGLLCLSDFAFRLSLLPEEVDKERGVILEEVRARKGVGQRIRDKLMPIVLPGSRVAERLPIGKEEVIAKATRDLLAGYYRRWYRPDNTTLLIVGDADADMVLELVRERFGQWQPTEDPPANADPAVKPYTSLRAAVLTDPELTEADVEVASVLPLETLATVRDFRRLLVDELAGRMFYRRLQEMIQKGTAPFQQISVSKNPFLNACTYVDASATGSPEQWQAMMETLLTELKRARVHGFRQRELDNAWKDILARTQQAALTEPTRDSRGFLSEMNKAVAEGRKPMSARQRLELTQALIGTVSLQDVWQAFRSNYPPDARLLSVLMPQKEGLPVPTADDLLALAARVEAAEVTPPPERTAPQALLEREPEPGEVVAREEDADLGILSVTLSNGVRAHLRSMDFKKDQVLIRITLGGGTIQETATNRGVTIVAALAFGQPATDTLSSTDIQDLMTGKNISFRGNAGADALTLSVDSATRDVEDAFRLIHLMLTRPRIEPSALDRWKEATAQAIEQRRIDVAAQAAEELAALISDDDPRFRALTREQLDALTLEAGQRWLDRMIRSAPIEMAVVGDIDRDRALELTLKYLGSLPNRPVRDPDLDALRKISHRSGPVTATVGVPTITPRAVVLEGWRGADWTDVKDRRILQILAQILSSRLREEIRENLGLTYTIYAFARPGRAYRGEGFFGISFTADPQKAAGAADLSLDVARKLADDGPTDEELHTVREQYRNSIETAQKEPAYWASVLGELDYRGTVLADVKEALRKYTTYSREEMMDVVRRYLIPGRRLQVIARPAAPAPGPRADSTERQPQGAVKE